MWSACEIHDANTETGLDQSDRANELYKLKIDWINSAKLGIQFRNEGAGV